MAVCALIAGCPLATNQQRPRSGSLETAPLVNRSVLLKDAKGATLGYVAETSASAVTVFTISGYFVSLSWDGTLTDGTCWYTGAEGTGTPFTIAPETDRLFGFSVSISGKPYVAAEVDGNGRAVADRSITGFQSYHPARGGAVDLAGAVPAGHVAYALRAATPAELGLPPVIAPLRQLVFK